MTEQKLPKHWKMVRFGDIAENISIRVNPVAGDEKKYIGLEHLDSGSLIVKRWGSEVVLKGQKLRIKKGDILFAKRNAYLKRVALAPFDGIFSAHGMVIRPINGLLLPEFLPFFMQSDTFMDRAISISEGSLSPTIKWKVLESQKFLIPNIDEQEKLLSIFMCSYYQEEMRLQTLKSSHQLKRSLMVKLLISMAKEENWPKYQVGKVCKSLVPGRNKPKIFNGNIPWVTTPDITEFYIPTKQQELYLSEEEVKNSGGKIVPRDAVVMSCVGELGRIAITKNEVVLNQQLHAFVCPEDIIPEFLAYSLLMQIRYMESVASQTTIPYLNKSNCESIPFFKPPVSRQREIVSHLQQIDEVINTIENKPKLEKSINKYYLVE